MDQKKIVRDILEINRRVCFNLWNIADVNSRLEGLSSRLILPQKRSGTIRVSEQESRVLYCGTLNSSDYFYSIETPTKELYSQKGMTPLSASSDLSMYLNRDDEFEKVVNVEFKAHNPRKEDIRKDIEKLIRERITGNWFHTLKNVDNRTIPALFDKFKESFLACSNMISRDLSLVFCFCIIEKKWACQKEFTFKPDQRNLSKYVDKFFDLDYSTTRKASDIHINDAKGWILIHK